MKKLILAFCLLPAIAFSQCGGSYRWRVKTATDSSVIDTSAIRLSIDSVVSIKRPYDCKHERQDEEKCSYTIVGRLIYWHLEADRDLHLAIQDTLSGNTIICEIPDTTCSSIKSGFLFNQIADARRTFLSTNKLGIYELTGVLFFDKPHHAIGASPMFSELHPIFKIKQYVVPK